MKVSIKDFQIIKSASLEFIPGLTVILGESNNGKTAVFRAVKSCIYNEPGTTYVRTGCKNYLVGLETNNHKIILQKGDNSLYMIDGKQYNKIGKTQLTEVADTVGISALNINGNTEKINFWDQMEKPFLLDRNSSELFRFIVDSGEDDNLNVTLRSMVSDKNKLGTDINLKEGSVEVLKQQINNMEALLAGSDDKIALCENIVAFGPMMSRLLTITTTITNITNTTNTINTINNNITNKRKEIETINKEMNTISYNISVLDTIKEFLTKSHKKSAELNQLNIILKNKVDYNAILPVLSKNIDTNNLLSEKLKRISELKYTINNTNVTKLQMSVSQDDITKLSTLTTVLQRVRLLQDNISNVVASITKLNEEIAPVLKEYNTIEVCPYCGNKIAKEVLS